MTRDVILTLGLLLSAALVARLVASLLRVPAVGERRLVAGPRAAEILMLVLFGALLGPSVLEVIDVPFDSIGAQLMFTLGVSLILFYGGLNLSVDVLRRGVGGFLGPGREHPLRTRPEVAFLCWTRETGVVPAALVGVLAGVGVPNNGVYASVVALAIIMTLVLQALPASWLAGRLGLLDGDAPAPPSPAPGTVG